MPKAISEDTERGIRLLYESEPNKARIARAFNVHVRTVYRVLGKIDPAEQRERRHEAMGRLGGKFADVVEQMIDGFKPDEAELSPMQRFTIAGICSDKLTNLDKRLAESKQEDLIEAAPLPETIEALAGALRNEMRSVEFLLRVTPAAAPLMDAARELETRLGRQLVPVEAEIVDLDDLDGGTGDVQIGGLGGDVAGEADRVPGAGA